MITIRTTKKEYPTPASAQNVKIILPDGTDITEVLGIRWLSIVIQPGEANRVMMELNCILQNDDEITSKFESYPALKRFVLTVEHDHGGISRERTEEEALEGAETAFFANDIDEEDVRTLNEFLADMSEKDFKDFASGEEEDIIRIRKSSPRNSRDKPVTDLIDDWLGV